jgi:hypothetical protein
MLFMLVDTRDPRYGGGFDPDAEREERWRPASWRQVVLAAGSLSCVAAAPGVGGPFANWVLTIAGVALCAQFVRVSLREDPPRRNRPLPASDDGD